jgi:hypothetical protein
MARTPRDKRNRTIVCTGLDHLSDKLGYSQSIVLGKLRMLHVNISAASLSNIKNDKIVGTGILDATAKGIKVLMQKELGMEFDEQAGDFKELQAPDWERSVVPEKLEPTNTGIKIYAAGRATVPEKTAFFEHARQELIEVGIRLKSFSTYFISQNDSAYKQHILNLLRDGVHIKGYLLDPECEQARVYFEDRSEELPSEKKSLEKIREVMDDLRELCAEIEAMQLPGKFEIFLYQHIPYCLYLIVDGESDNGKMMVSPYLYGTRRANCPVFEFARKDQPILFERYLEAYKSFVKGTRKLE